MATRRGRFDRLRTAAKRRARVFIETCLGVALAGAALAYLLPSQYQAEALLQGGSPTQIAETIAAGATRTTVETVVDYFGLVAGPPGSASRERTIAAARSNTGLEVVGGTGLRVSFTSSDPALSQRVTQRLAERLVDGVAQNRSAGDQSVLGAELMQLEAMLAERRSRLDDVRRTRGADTPAQLADTSRALSNAQAQARQLGETIARDREELRAEGSRTRAPMDNSVDRESRAAQLASARASLEALETRLTPAHPDVTRQRAQVKELEAAVSRDTAQRAPSAAPNEAATRMLNDRLASREAQLARLQRSITAMRASLNRAPAQSAEVQALQVDYDALERLHASLTTKARMLSANGLGAAADPMRLVRAATLPTSPVSPNRRRILLFSFAAALLLATALAGVLEARDLAIYDEEDLRSLTDAPLLGVISEVLTPARAAAARTRTAMRSVLALLAGIVLVAAWWWAR